MRSRRRPEEQVNHERWMISYADFVSLLFAFFVVLFATTYRDNQTVRKLSQAIHNGFQTMGAFKTDENGYGGPYPSTPPKNDVSNSRIPEQTAKGIQPPTDGIDVVELRKELQSVLGKELEDHEIVVQVTPEGFTVSLKELGFFNSGQAHLLPGADQKLKKIAKVLSKPGLELRVEGHSDNQPIHNAQFSSNWELSTARAMTVLLLLVNDSGFDPHHISASGYGEFRPVADNSTVEGRRSNRRVDIVVVRART